MEMLLYDQFYKSILLLLFEITSRFVQYLNLFFFFGKN